MQVSVETGEGLERKLKVQVPSEKIDTEVETRLRSMQGRVKIDGFRPGKVPLKVVKQRYGDQVLQEVAGEIMQRTFQEAVTQENLRPAGTPQINTEKLQPGQPLEYTATFEIYPEIELAPVSKLKLEKISAEASASDVDNMLETLRKQKTDWKQVDRAAAEGDRVSIDFTGTIEGEAFEGGSAENVPVIIGSGSMIPGFEDQLTGLSSGGETTIKTPFPDDYHAKDLAGKAAEFAVTVSKVEAPELPEIDEAFARAFGVEDGSVETLRDNIMTNMQRELSYRIKADLKTQVMDKLIEANSIEVPESTVKQEAEALQQQASQEQPGLNTDLDAFMPDAKRRVQLGMVIGEVIKLSGIRVDQEKVSERLATMAQDYEDPDEFVRYYQSNPQMLRGVETLVMEDMVVDWVAEQASVSSVNKTFDEVMKPASSA